MKLNPYLTPYTKMNSTKTPKQPVNKAKPCLLEFIAVTEDTTLTESSVKFSSVAQSCPTLCNPMNCTMTGLPVHHQLPELTQTHVHLVGDAIQPSHPLSSPSPPAFNLSQHQGLFQWVSSSYQVAKVLTFSFNISPSSEYFWVYSCMSFNTFIDSCN